MPTLTTHAASAAAMARMYAGEKAPWRLWLLSAFCAMLPDADVLGLAFGVPYGSLWGHRGLTHSLLFALAAGAAAAWADDAIAAAGSGKTAKPAPHAALALYYAAVTASHGVLDAFTDGGRGIAFFSPFDQTRYFFPWRPIHVSPIGLSNPFSPRMRRVLSSEIIYIWIPFWALALAIEALRRLRSPKLSREP